jgi:DNA-binding beta-propeller fold protein YncE
VNAPASVVGPPLSVAITPDESLALVTAAMKIDTADPTKQVPDNKLSVIDLKASPPAVRQTLQAGSGASGVSINLAGTLALVANRIEGTVSIFTIAGRTLTPAGKVDLGAPESGPCHVAFTRDGRMALVTRNNDSLISILQIDGTRVTYTKRDFAAGLKPYSIQMSPAAPLAVVAHVGAGPTGSADVLSIVDLSVDPPRAVEHAAVGPIAEGIAISHDGKYVAVTVMNGTNAPTGSPLFNPSGRLRVYAVAPRSLTPIAEAPLGRWCQGAAWSRDGRTLLAQCMVEQEIQVFSFDGRALTKTGAIKVGGGPAGIRTADPR